MMIHVLKIGSYIAGALVIAAIVIVAIVGLFAVFVEKTFGQGGR